MNDSKKISDVMTVKEVADHLRVAASTVYRLAQDGEIPCKKVGGHWRFSRKVLNLWLQEEQPTSNEELNNS